MPAAAEFLTPTVKGQKCQHISKHALLALSTSRTAEGGPTLREETDLDLVSNLKTFRLGLKFWTEMGCDNWSRLWPWVHLEYVHCPSALLLSNLLLQRYYQVWQGLSAKIPPEEWIRCCNDLSLQLRSEWSCETLWNEDRIDVCLTRIWAPGGPRLKC